MWTIIDELTDFALAWLGQRTDDRPCKFIRYHGIWDLDELYDMQVDPDETRNLIAEPSYAGVAEKLRKRLFDVLEETNGLTMNLAPDRGRWFPWRHPERAEQGTFSPSFFEPPLD